jgi:hypothetical protein
MSQAVLFPPRFMPRLEVERWGVLEKASVGALAAAIALIPALAPPGQRPNFPGNASPVDLVIGLAVGLTFLWALSTRVQLRLPYGLSVGLFMVAGLLPAMFHFPLPALLAVLQDLVLLCFVAAIVNVSRNAGAFNILTATWAYAAIVWAAAMVSMMLLGRPDLAGVNERWGTRAGLTFGDPNMAGTYYVLGIFIVAATRRPRNRILRLAAYAVLVLAILYTGSNGSLVGLAVGTSVAVMVGAFKRLPTMHAVVLVAAVALFGMFAAFQLQPSSAREVAGGSQQPLLQSSLGRTEDSAALRETLVEEASKLFIAGGPLGWGAASTESALLQQQATFVKGTHNDYVAALVERGVLGFAVLLMLAGSIGVRIWSSVRRPIKADFAAAMPATGPLLAGVCAISATALFYQVLHFRHVWLTFAMVAVLHVWGQRR